MTTSPRNESDTVDESRDAFAHQLLNLARTLKIDPLVAENQVLDRVALSFRKLLNFLAQHAELTEIYLLAYPSKGTSPSGTVKAQLTAIMQDNFADAHSGGIFRKDIPIALLADFFTALLLQLVQIPADPQGRHQQSLAATRLFCEGAWLGKE